jgi:RNA polymerase sigma factor (sigma-70 family)
VIFDNMDKTMAQLYRYSLTLTRSPWTAEDLVQETLIKVYTIKKTDPQREFTNSFLYTVAKNLFIDEQRKKKAVATFREELHQYEVDYTGCESIVEELLLKLPVRQAILITLKDVFGYHSQEIAAMLRVTDESVKTALSRSRSRLKKLSKDTPQIHHQPTDKELIFELTRAINQSNPASLFTLCRLLESRKYSLSRVSGSRYMHVVDPDGNVLEITC